MLLLQTVDAYCDFEDHRTIVYHTFSDFMLFSLQTGQATKNSTNPDERSIPRVKAVSDWERAVFPPPIFHPALSERMLRNTSPTSGCLSECPAPCPTNKDVPALPSIPSL